MKPTTVAASTLALAAPLVCLDCGGGGISTPGQLQRLGVDIDDGTAWCEELGQGELGKLSFKGSAALRTRIVGWLEATLETKRASVALEQSLVDACSDLGTDLGLAPSRVGGTANGDGKTAERACKAASSRVEEVIRRIEGTVTVSHEAPRCRQDLGKLAACYQACGAPIEPADAEAGCREAIVGECRGDCQGECRSRAGAACSGKCAGACGGKCEVDFTGRCGGKCTGKCDGKPADGSCGGLCEGACASGAEGSCGGTCEGTCSAGCVGKAKKCDGTCPSCSAKLESPQCTGEFELAEVDASCLVPCAARVKPDCDPPGLHLKIQLKNDSKVSSDALTLFDALQRSLPKIAAAQHGVAKHLLHASREIGESAQRLRVDFAEGGGKAIACLVSAVDLGASATQTIEATMRVSSSVWGAMTPQAKQPKSPRYRGRGPR